MRREDIDGWKVIGTGNLFTRLDVNTDGYVEVAEIDSFTAPRFADFDLDHNGYITEVEAEKYEKLRGY
jgi:Ca2+-binding EF-hand superfamily protein